jgi:phthalate 4,5-cis-dihydrodiol dehydrogenase
MKEAPIRLGVAGLGRAFTIMLPTFTRDPRITLAGAADPRPEATFRFMQDFGAPSYASIEELCADRSIEAIYIATPHQFHAEHAKIAASCGKHILVEKPMAITIAECSDMIGAAKTAGVFLIAGPSHSFDAPVGLARSLIKNGAFGRVRAITAMNYTDFLFRPRRREELLTEEGGGVVFGQGSHQIDIIRLIGGGLVKTVRAETGRWDPLRPTEGAYSALLTFEDGAFATAIYSGYAHFDSDEFCGWTGELGQLKDPGVYGSARAALAAASLEDEEAMKTRRAYGGAFAGAGHAVQHEHFGFILISCGHADLRPVPQGVWIYGDSERRLEKLPPPSVPRTEVITELFDAVRRGIPPLHSGEWGRATLEACFAVLQSAAAGTGIDLCYQTSL